MTTLLKKKLSISDSSPLLIPINDDSHSELETFSEYGIGMNVHKDSIALCVSGRLPTNDYVQIQEHNFKNTYVGVNELCQFLKRFSKATTFLMECTGVYHVALYRALQEKFPHQIDIIIAMNPLLVHNRIEDLGSKTDRADARTLSSLALYHSILRPRYVGSVVFFAIRDLMRSYHRNTTQVTRLINRIHRQLHLANQKFKFDLNAEWGLHLLDQYINQSWSLGACYNHLFSDLKTKGKYRVLEKKQEEIVPHAEVILADTQRFILQMDLLCLMSSQQSSANFLHETERQVLLTPSLAKHYQHMRIIPGFSSATILTVLTKIGDYSRFRNANIFCKFCGVVPNIQQSGNYSAKGHVNRFTNKHLRSALSQAAAAVIGRSNKDTDIDAFAYKQRFLRHMPFKKAMLKVAQKYARILYGMFNEIRQYDPHFEINRKKAKRLKVRLEKQNNLIESVQTRALKRNISNFLVANSELLNSTSRYHLFTGFHRLIQKSRYREKEDHTK
ncbi:IS110 family RNA-guided transposase [Candidatus Lokiarchaeum ossiferum]